LSDSALIYYQEMLLATRSPTWSGLPTQEPTVNVMLVRSVLISVFAIWVISSISCTHLVSFGACPGPRLLSSGTDTSIYYTTSSTLSDSEMHGPRDTAFLWLMTDLVNRELLYSDTLARVHVWLHFWLWIHALRCCKQHKAVFCENV
jgi:hypothetical protein